MFVFAFWYTNQIAPMYEQVRATAITLTIAIVKSAKQQRKQTKRKKKKK